MTKKHDFWQAPASATTVLDLLDIDRPVTEEEKVLARARWEKSKARVDALRKSLRPKRRHRRCRWCGR